MIICERYKWTHSQYKSNPSWFLELLRVKMITEGEYDKAQKERAKSAEKKSSKPNKL